MNQKSSNFNQKCDAFKNEMDQLFELNRQLQDEKRKEGPRSVSVRLELDQRQKQMKQMQT